jgi:hypothetical protein
MAYGRTHEKALAAEIGNNYDPYAYLDGHPIAYNEGTHWRVKWDDTINFFADRMWQARRIRFNLKRCEEGKRHAAYMRALVKARADEVNNQ